MILHSYELYFTAEVTLINQKMGLMSCKIHGQGTDEATEQQNLPFISKDASLLKQLISFCCFRRHFRLNLKFLCYHVQDGFEVCWNKMRG